MSLEELAPSVTPKALCDLLSFAMTINSPETTELNLPDFPIDNLYRAVRVLVSVKLKKPKYAQSSLDFTSLSRTSPVDQFSCMCQVYIQPMSSRIL